MSKTEEFNIFNKIKDSLLSMDPVAFCEKNLTLDGKDFRLTNNGYKPFADIYRYIGVKALEPDAKPVILVKGRQVGATTMATALEMYFMGCGRFGNQGRPPIRLIHGWPTLDFAFDYSKTKLSAMISQSVAADPSSLKKGVKPKSYMQALIDTSASTNDSSQFKQFIGGNHIWIESAGLNGDRFRGKTADCIFFDEVQDIPSAALGNAVKVLTKASYGPVGDGIQVYFGTPKQRGSDYFQMWQMSSQQYYHLGCEKCEKHFPLYTPGSNDWEKIWIHGFIVRCTHCGHEQDKRLAAERGKWVPLKDPKEAKLVGFHINQLYIPEFTKEKIIAEKPENHPINTERSYQNEVLGEFYQGESGVITPDQIRDKCGDPERKFRAFISSNDNKICFLGLDIGKKADLEQLVSSKKVTAQGQSYSTAVVLTLEGPNLLSIDRALKFKKNDLESKKGLVEQIMKQYNIALGICDIGYANDFNEIMQTEYGDKFLSSEVSGKINDHIKYDAEAFPKIIRFEKDYYISELYEQMKKGCIRFPLGDYEQISWLIQHCSSMEIKPTMTRSGEVTPHFIKGSTPNDGFMALLNAYLAYKFYISNGFTIKNPLLYNKPNINGKINKTSVPVLGGYIPRMK